MGEHRADPPERGLDRPQHRELNSLEAGPPPLEGLEGTGAPERSEVLMLTESAGSICGAFELCRSPFRRMAVGDLRGLCPFSRVDRHAIVIGVVPLQLARKAPREARQVLGRCHLAHTQGA
jgi:hypothetical protein